MLPVLMLILSYQIILKSKFSTQSCVYCAFLFNVDNNCIYKHWLIWTQWWQAWNWFPLCNSSDQINQFALHCWFDLRWSSDCQGQCHHCIGSMFNDLSILTPLFIYDYQSAFSCVCSAFIRTTQPICLHASFISLKTIYVEIIDIEYTGYLFYGPLNK